MNNPNGNNNAASGENFEDRNILADFFPHSKESAAQAHKRQQAAQAIGDHQPGVVG